MKKNILIVIPSFGIGGTIVSLQSLLSLIDTSKYEIDIFALDRKGVYLDKMPNCRVLPENKWLSFRCNNGSVFTKIFVQCLRFLRISLSKLGINILPFLCKIGGRQIGSKDYDVVVSYVESISKIVCYYPAKKRVAWIHCEYARYLNLNKIKPEEKEFKLYDKVVCVSEFAKKGFIEAIPSAKDKVVAIHNIINEEYIWTRAKENIELDRKFVLDSFTIISVGRIDLVKQFDKIPFIAKEIKEKTNIPFRWYIIGGGDKSIEQTIIENIKRYNLDDVVILLGEKINVYPYMNKSDLYVSTSLSETFSLVIHEAKILNIPIVTNDFGCAAEVVENNIDGYIIPINKMSNTIVSLMKDKVVFNKIKQNLLNKNYNNDNLYKLIYSIF